MTEEQKRDDLRVVKTRRVITQALFKLTKTYSFKKITVNRLCIEAQISRATFYAHFEDKYDLLRYALNVLTGELGFDRLTYEKIDRFAAEYLMKNKAVVKNILADADVGTAEIIYGFLLSTVGITERITGKLPNDLKYIVFSNMFTGGIMNYMSWQIKHKFPEDTPIWNVEIYELLKNILDWINNE